MLNNTFRGSIEPLLTIFTKYFSKISHFLTKNAVKIIIVIVHLIANWVPLSIFISKLKKKSDFKYLWVGAVVYWPTAQEKCYPQKKKKYDQSFPFNECNLPRNPIKIAYLSIKMTEPTKDLSQWKLVCWLIKSCFLSRAPQYWTVSTKMSIFWSFIYDYAKWPSLKKRGFYIL